jgi:anthranilate/para-aminobenzoate synthase component I
VALPGGPLLESYWEQGTWKTYLQGELRNESPWEALRSALERHPLPWVGAASYEVCCAEASHAFQPPLEGSLGMTWRGVTQAIHRQDASLEVWTFGDSTHPALPSFGTSCALQRAKARLEPRWRSTDHRHAVEEIQQLIRDGAFYVANLCMPFEGDFSGDPVTFALAALRKARPPYGAFLPAGNGHLLCLSMERLLARRGSRITTEPIKGSAPFMGAPEEDASAAKAMKADPKERAEHTMIVDLLRNDLGREAVAGSVHVEAFMEVETFPTVQHLVSRIGATLRPEVSLPQLLRAVLPGGSVTGAPKHAVCHYLSRTEAGPRGFYCGALGWILPDGDMDLSLPIRTAQLRPDRITYWTGGGITRRSQADEEWRELFLKARVLEGIADLTFPAQP